MAKTFNIGGNFVDKLEWNIKKRRTSDAFYKNKAMPSSASKLLGNKSSGWGRDQNSKVSLPGGVNPLAEFKGICIKNDSPLPFKNSYGLLKQPGKVRNHNSLKMFHLGYFNQGIIAKKKSTAPTPVMNIISIRALEK